MSFDAKTISLILGIVLGVFILWGIIWGLIRGFKNSLYRGVFIVFVLALAFFIASMISRAIINGNIGDIVPLEVNGEKVRNLKDYLSLQIKQNLETTADTAGAVESLLTVISIAINSFVFVIVFFLVKWILSPVYSALTRWVFNKKQYRKEQVQSGKKVKTKWVKIKTRKYRLAGAGVGAVLGLLVCAFTFMPIMGYINMAQSVEDSTKKENNAQVGVISDLVGEKNYNIVMDGYNKSIFSGVMKYTGMDYLSGVVFNSLSSTKVNKVNVNLRKEVETGLQVYNSAKNIKAPDWDTCTKEELNTFLTNCRVITNTAFKSGVVNSSLSEIMPIVVDYLIRTDMIQNLDGAKKVFAVHALENLAVTHSEEIKTEVLNLVGLAQTLNDYNLAIPILQNNTGNVVEFLQATTNREVVRDITDKLFALQSVNKVAPDITNVLVEYISGALNLQDQIVESVTSAKLKESMQNILFSMVDILPNLDSKSSYYVTKNAVKGIGKVIDNIKSAPFMTDAMFEATIDKVQDKLSEQIASVPSWAQNIANEAIANLSNITNYTTEFEKIYLVVDNVDNACKDSAGKRSTDLNDIDFARIGVALDGLEDLTLAKRQNPKADELDNLVPNLVLEAIDHYSKDSSITIDLSAFASVNQLKTNIKDIKNVNWTNDLPKLKQLVVVAKNIVSDSTSIADKMKDAGSKQEFVDLGEALDMARTAMLFAGNNVDRLFMQDILDIVDDNYSSDADMLNAIASIRSNITIASSITWKNEFDNIIELVNMDFDNVLSDTTVEGEKSKAYTLGEKIDNIIGNSNIITADIIDTFICTVVDDNFSGTSYENMVNLVKKTFSDVDGDSANGYKNGIDYYAVEFDALNTLYQARSVVDDGTFNLADDAEALGKKVDDAINTTTIIEGKVFGTKLVNSELIDVFIKDILSEKFDSSDTKFGSAYNLIVNKFSDVDGDSTNGYKNAIDNYTVEFMALGRLQSVVDYVQSSTFEFKTNGRALGELIDIALATSYNGHTTKVVNEELIDAYIRNLLDDYIAGDADLVVTKNAIKSKFNKNSSSSEYINAVDYYEVEFWALSRLISEIIDAGINVNDCASRTSIGAKLDDICRTRIEYGQTTDPHNEYTQVVVPSVLNPYIKTKVSAIDVDADYVSVKHTLVEDINSYLDKIDLTQSSPTYSYTKCFEDINTLDIQMSSIDTNKTDWVGTENLRDVQNRLNTVQNTAVFSTKLSREMMLIVLDKIYQHYNDGTLPEDALKTKTKSLRAYKLYLQNNLNLAEKEPYTYDTIITVNVDLDGETISVRRNKPLEYIYEQITA